MTGISEGRIKDLISTGDRQMAAQSFDAAADTFRTALAEASAEDVRALIEARLAQAENARETAQRIAVLLRDARYRQTAGRFPEAYAAIAEVLSLEPANSSAAQMRDQLLAAMPELANLPPAPLAAESPERSPAPAAVPAVPEPAAGIAADQPAAAGLSAAPPPEKPAPVPETPRLIEPPALELIEDSPYVLERPSRREWEEEPPLSILNPRPSVRQNPYAAAWIVGLALIMGMVVSMVTHRAVSRRRASSGTPDVGTYSISDGATAPVLISKVDPEYTDAARADGIQGAVVLEVAVETDGSATVVGVLQSLDPGLDQRAREAVRWWRFQPGTKNGKPVRVVTRLEVNFRLP